MILDRSVIFSDLTNRYPLLAGVRPEFEKALNLLQSAISKGGKIMTCGNGGSAADAEHIVGELMKSFLLSRPLLPKQMAALRESCPHEGGQIGRHLQGAIPAISLVSGISFPTAYANDISFEYLFAQQVFGLGKSGDVLWGLSTSGNSLNVIHAFRVAKAFGITTLGFTGRDGGTLAELSDVEIRVPSDSTPEIQEMHLPLYHAICAALELYFFENLNPPI